MLKNRNISYVKKLSEDHIQWILSLDASNADREIHKLSQRNKELETRNKELCKSMQVLEMQNKKDSDAYRKLSAELTKNNQKLSKNREAIKRLSQQRGIINLSMSQLRRRTQDLQAQMDRTSKSLHPQEWKKLNRQLNETNARIGQLKNSRSIIKDAFSVKISTNYFASLSLLLRETSNFLSRINFTLVLPVFTLFTPLSFFFTLVSPFSTLYNKYTERIEGEKAL